MGSLPLPSSKSLDRGASGLLMGLVGLRAFNVWGGDKKAEGLGVAFSWPWGQNLSILSITEGFVASEMLPAP